MLQLDVRAAPVAQPHQQRMSSVNTLPHHQQQRSKSRSPIAVPSYRRRRGGGGGGVLDGQLARPASASPTTVRTSLHSPPHRRGQSKLPSPYNQNFELHHNAWAC